jgi:hypothetical protein
MEIDDVAAENAEEGATVVVRVWLPDRPGALGAVASRIGAVGGDVLSIDVLERGGGRAVDELTVALPDPDRVDLLVAEIRQVDGVDVEDVHPSTGGAIDRQVAAVRAAAALGSVADAAHAYAALCEQASALLDAEWVAVLDAEVGEVLASTGAAVPDAAWLVAFAIGVTGGDAHGTVDELAFCRLDDPGRWAVLSRRRLPLRFVERSVFEELARVAVRRRAELAERSAAGPPPGALHGS